MNRAPIVLLFLAALAVAGCSPEIGDDCTTSADCGSGAICDTSQAGGYCTQTPCQPGSCPSEAACIEFAPEVTYCMRKCSAPNDCRYGQKCVKDLPDPAGKTYPGFCNQTDQPADETESP